MRECIERLQAMRTAPILLRIEFICEEPHLRILLVTRMRQTFFARYDHRGH